MGIQILHAMAREGFEEVLAIQDRRSKLRAFLGIHDTSRGPAFGGVRRWVYRDEEQALLDCLRLARGMTHKCVLAGLPAGGGKLVMLDHPELDARLAYLHVGELVERLGGRFNTGPDVGTGTQELSWIAERTRFVTRPGGEGPGQLVDSTCEGVVAGMAATLRHIDGEEDWPRRTVVVQGLGGVGRGVAARLRIRGARVLASDLDSERAASVASEIDLELVDPATELDAECDVLAPCAMGGILHDLSIERLRCRVVAGGANNVLARSVHGDRLHERGILFAPDIVITSGALIRGALFQLEGRREPPEAIGGRIADCLAGILERAREERRPTARVALDEADERLERSHAPRD